MRGIIIPQEVLFNYVNLEERIPVNHQLRKIKQFTDECLKKLSGVFDQLYVIAGRTPIPPEMLIKAILLRVLYGIRIEIQLMQEWASAIRMLGRRSKPRVRVTVDADKGYDVKETIFGWLKSVGWI